MSRIVIWLLGVGSMLGILIVMWVLSISHHGFMENFWGAGIVIYTGAMWVVTVPLIVSGVLD
jgi:hypothetical protein